MIISDELISHIYNWFCDESVKDKLRAKKLAGYDALFIPIDDKCGIKVFANTDVAKFTYHISRILFHFGYTGKVWDLQSIKLSNYVTLFGYMCERVKLYHEIESHRYEKYLSAVIKLNNILSETPFINLDLTEKNFGLRDDGTPICIDLSDLYISYNNTSKMIKKIK